MRSFAVFLLLFPHMLIAQRSAPAYPLITHDPYFSVWSFSDTLNSSPTVHWTGATQPIHIYAKVDGIIYRIGGAEERSYQTILPMASEKTYSVKYTEKMPSADWMKEDFKAVGWKTGVAPFGSTDLGKPGTIWNSDNIWAIREFSLSSIPIEQLYLQYFHDDNTVVYLNGKKIFERTGWTNKPEYFPIQNFLKKGKNVLAFHVKNTAGGQWLDAGVVVVKTNKEMNAVKNAQQTGLKFTATQTIYTHNCGPVSITTKFISPLLINEPEELAQPVSYIHVSANANDGKPHHIQLLWSLSSNLAVNNAGEEVKVEAISTKDFLTQRVGTTSQKILGQKGDDVRINWGYLYTMLQNAGAANQFITASVSDGLKNFSSGSFSSIQNKTGKQFYLNNFQDLGKTQKSEVTLAVGYDDLYSLEYFNERLRPWWNINGNVSLTTLMEARLENFENVLAKCNSIDERIYNDAENAAGEEYAKLCVMAYRQSLAAHKLLKSPQGDLLFMSKENFSNGSVNTVDITYPSSPLYLLYNPELLKGMMNGIFYYSESGKWPKPFAAHDLGTYPIANGQTYGDDMPIEEAGNMIILASAISKVEGNANYAKKHWQTLTTWVNYLVENGLDPANQLCTDDFAGHFARNANLSLKAIMAIRGYAMMADMLGDKPTEEKYKSIAKDYSEKWQKMADAGDHYSLVFEKPDTWSQKYNIIWDKVLGFHLFPKTVAEKELAWYSKKQNAFGLPLDNRRTYTKSDWIVWTASLSDNPEEFKALTSPIYKFATETTDRIPLSDWHETTNGKSVGFRARSVVGGYFMKVLEQKLTRK